MKNLAMRSRSVYVERLGNLCLISLFMVSICGFSLEANAASTEEMLQQMQQQMQALQQRVNQLEERNRELESKLGEQTEIPKEIVPTVKDQNFVRSNFDMDIYGYVKFDAAYDTHRMDNGNFATWVQSEQFSDDDGTFNMTSRQSRFGFNIYGPDLGSFKSSGKFEMDFYGAGGAENKSIFRMRKAYLKLDWPEEDFSILAGQDYDIISPLLPTTVNFLVQGRAGNIGYRHPQLTLTKGFGFNNDSRFQIEAGVSRTIGDNPPNSPGDTGEDAGFPTMQSRLSYTFPFLSGQKTTVGVSGHYGQEEWDIDNADNNVDYDSWSINLDLNVPFTEQVGFKGEVYTGENLDDYYGGILQGVNSALMTEIAATGGWGAISYTPNNSWDFNVGYSMEDVENDDLNTQMRSENKSIFGNVFYKINKATLVGFETSYWDTEYVDIDDGDSLRFQGTLIYKF